MRAFSSGERGPLSSSSAWVSQWLAAELWLEVGQALWWWCLGWVAPRHVESSQTRDWTHVPCSGRQILNQWTSREVQFIIDYYLLFNHINNTQIHSLCKKLNIADNAKKSFWSPWLHYPFCLPRGNHYCQFDVSFSALSYRNIHTLIENKLFFVFGQLVFWAVPRVALHIHDYFLRHPMRM